MAPENEQILRPFVFIEQKEKSSVWKEIQDTWKGFVGSTNFQYPTFFLESTRQCKS